MSATAPRSPVTRSTRQRRRHPLAAVSAHHGSQAARSATFAKAGPQATDLPTAHQDAKVKPWQIALGFLALLCSGIDLG